MGPAYNSSQYEKLVKQNTPTQRSVKSAEDDLDAMINMFQNRECKTSDSDTPRKPDKIENLRTLMKTELISVFVDLMEKYSKTGMSMDMDASNFLEGGREIRFEFGVGECRAELLGTVTEDAIAFHEVRHNPHVRGELVSGPMLRLRNLDASIFREFICERLTILLRDAMPRV